MPPRITPAQLGSNLALAGFKVTLRTLRLRRTQGLLPALRAQGRKGYRRGKGQFWRSPNLIEQAIFVSKLRALKYPNDEARLALWCLGFPVEPSKVRNAWKSRLGKTSLLLESKIETVVRKRSAPFTTTEDEISAILKAQLTRPCGRI
jgi:hypothetical protein